MSPVVFSLGSEGYGGYRFEVVGGVPRLERAQGRTEGFLIPGLVDVHFHGAFGVDVMTASAESIAGLADRLETLGYEGFLPTTITAPVADVRRFLSALPAHRAILGWHMEGPFISPDFPGAQPESCIVAPAKAQVEFGDVLDDARLRIVTLAPEVAGAEALVRKLVNRGVRVSLGHTNASLAVARDAVCWGASHVTHTFNAMRGLHHREPGVLGVALTDDRLLTELIYDRHHVVKEAADVLVRCAGGQRLVGVSDSSPATGLPDGTRLAMWGHECTVGEGTVRLVSNGALAGSTSTLLDVFRNLCDDFGPEVAISACAVTPRRAAQMTGPVHRHVLFDQNLAIVDIFDAERGRD